MRVNCFLLNQSCIKVVCFLSFVLGLISQNIFFSLQGLDSCLFSTRIVRVHFVCDFHIPLKQLIACRDHCKLVWHSGYNDVLHLRHNLAIWIVIVRIKHKLESISRSGRCNSAFLEIVGGLAWQFVQQIRSRKILQRNYSTFEPDIPLNCHDDSTVLRNCNNLCTHRRKYLERTMGPIMALDFFVNLAGIRKLICRFSGRGKLETFCLCLSRAFRPRKQVQIPKLVDNLFLKRDFNSFESSF